MEGKNETRMRKQVAYQKSVCKTVVQSALQTREDALQRVICPRARNQMLLFGVLFVLVGVLMKSLVGVCIFLIFLTVLPFNTIKN